MAPIHETDLAADRWEKAQWSQYELWERLEVRLRRRKLLWIAATLAVFLALSSIPIIIDRTPKWAAMSAARRLAQVVGGLKGEASTQHRAYRVRFGSEGSLQYTIEKVASCTDSVSGEVVRSGDLGRGDLVLLTPEQGLSLQIPEVVNSLCYDPYTGSSPAAQGKPLVGFAILSAKDLTTGRTDRLSVLLVQGPSAELSFD
jgi:hypothetical protein